MKMDGKLRVATEASYKELYNNMKSVGVVDDFHELFFVCACIGYRKGQSSPIKKRDDRFWSSTINPTEWTCYYSMILEQNDFDYIKVSDDKEVISTIEGYANAGMKILIDEFLSDYLVNSSKALDPQLDITCSKELPKAFIHYIFDQTQGSTASI